jgi:nucleoside-diphosphate-sugar epimerase
MEHNLTTAINEQAPVLVTGGSGYLASHIAARLLEQGHTVHITVRDITKEQAYAHLLKIGETTSGTLKVFEADLLTANAFAGAMDGCSHVFHTASPFRITGIKNARTELVDPAVEGTRNILDTVNKTASVKRVVLTSSVVAIMGDAIDAKYLDGGIFTEAQWNTSSTLSYQPYAYSKTMAEKTAWEMANAQKRWSMVVMNPGFILGPSLSKRTSSTSIDFMLSMGKGTYKTGVPAMHVAIVDVRDVAEAHLAGAFRETASGRHIIAREVVSFSDLAGMLRKEFPQYPLPSRQIPKWLFMIMGPLFGLGRKYIRRNTGIPFRVDNTYGIRDLGIEYTPAEKTLTDHFRQLIDDGLLPAR